MLSSVRDRLKKIVPASSRGKFLVAVVGLALIAVGIFSLVQRDTPPKTATRQTASPYTQDTFSPNEPKTKIYVGKMLYRDPCRLFPLSSFQLLYGGLSDTGYVREAFLTGSATGSPKKATDALSQPTTCTYQKSSADLQPHVLVEQNYYETERIAYGIWRYEADLRTAEKSDYIAAESKLGDAVKRGELSEAQIKNAKAILRDTLFVQNMPITLQGVADANEKEYRNMVIFSPGSQRFYLVQERVVIALKIPSPFGELEEPVSSLKPAALAEYFDKAKKTVDIISKNFSDTSLPQGPVSATLGIENFGKLYEPCEIFQAQTVASATSRQLRLRATQISVPRKPSTPSQTKSIADGKTHQIPKSNSCQYDYGSTLNQEEDGIFTLTAYYAKDAPAAKQYLQDARSGWSGSEDVQLPKTDEAWFAPLRPIPSAPDKNYPSVLFMRHGRTVLKLSLNGKTPASEDVVFSKDTYMSVANSVASHL